VVVGIVTVTSNGPGSIGDSNEIVNPIVPIMYSIVFRVGDGGQVSRQVIVKPKNMIKRIHALNDMVSSIVADDCRMQVWVGDALKPPQAVVMHACYAMLTIDDWIDDCP